MPIVDNPAALSCGCNHQQNFPSMGSGEGFEWDPSGVTFGIDFTTDRIYDGETVTDDYSTVLGGGFDPGDVSGLGMALFDGGQTPDAIGPLLAKLDTLDYTIVYFWRQSQNNPSCYLLAMLDIDELAQGEIYHETGELYASARDGNYPLIGTVREFSDNVLAVSHSPAGWLASLNGETAVLDEVATVADIINAHIGHGGGGDWLEGWLKALIFYPATNAAGVESYSASAAPTNSATPVISGTAQVGQQLSITNGTWTGSPSSYQYQWYRGSYNAADQIGGATANTFTPTVAEEGFTMLCVVYALNAEGIGGIGVSDDVQVAPA